LLDFAIVVSEVSVRFIPTGKQRVP